MSSITLLGARRGGKTLKSVLPLSVSDRYFINSQGQRVFLNGVTAFALVKLYESGIDIRSFLEYFNRSNKLRVFWYTPRSDWGNNYWNLPSISALVDFHKYVGDKGFYVENTCVTDSPSLDILGQVRVLIAQLNKSGLTNVMYEAVNEPYIHDKLEPSELKNALNASPYLYTSGVYADGYQSKFYGKFFVEHSDRTYDWPRKCKNLEEFWDTYRIPCKEDEPTRPDICLSQGRTAGQIVEDYYSYGAGCKFFGAGFTFHNLNGELGLPPNDFDYACYTAAVDGTNIYPDDVTSMQFEHRKDLEGPLGDDGNPIYCLRVFQKGNFGLVFRDTGLLLPSNWIPLDKFKCAYKIN